MCVGGGGEGTKGRSSLHTCLALLWRHDYYYRNLTLSWGAKLKSRMMSTIRFDLCKPLSNLQD